MSLGFLRQEADAILIMLAAKSFLGILTHYIYICERYLTVWDNLIEILDIGCFM